MDCLFVVSRLLVGRSLARLVVCCLGWVALGCHWLAGPVSCKTLGLEGSLGLEA